jgi:5-methylcytosine-specific restriction protein A
MAMRANRFRPGVQGDAPRLKGGWGQTSKASRHERGYGKEWDKKRERKLREQPLCEYCLAKGKITPAKSVDHNIPKAEGGTDDWENLRSACDPCHKTKTAEESKRGAANARQLTR